MIDTRNNLPDMSDAYAKVVEEGKKKDRWQDDDGDGKWYEKSDVDGKISKREKEEKKKNQKEEVEGVDEKISASGYARAKKWREDQARQKDREDNAKWEEKARTHKWDGKKWNKRDKPTHEKGTGPHARKLAGESVEYELEEERAARKMNVRTKGTIKKQIAKDAAAEAKRREKKTGEYAEKPKRKPRLKKPSQLTTVKAEPKKEAPKPKAKPAAKKAAPKPKAKPVAAAKKVTPKAAPKKSAPKAKAKPAPKKAAPKPVAKKAAPKKEAPKKSSSLSDKARDWVKKGVKRHRKATQGARVFGKGFVKGAKDTVKFAGKVKKAVVGEELMSFKAYVNLNEDYYRGTGEKGQARTLAWMRKKGMKGSPGLNAMKAREAEHKAKRGVKGVKEEMEIDEATRLKKEKGYDKGGTKKPSGKPTAMSIVLDKIRKEHGHGAVVGLSLIHI